MGSSGSRIPFKNISLSYAKDVSLYMPPKMYIFEPSEIAAWLVRDGGQSLFNQLYLKGHREHARKAKKKGKKGKRKKKKRSKKRGNRRDITNRGRVRPNAAFYIKYREVEMLRNAIESTKKENLISYSNGCMASEFGRRARYRFHSLEDKGVSMKYKSNKYR